MVFVVECVRVRAWQLFETVAAPNNNNDNGNNDDDDDDLYIL